MACHEAEPWTYPSSGNKCGCCRVGHGLRYSRTGGGGALRRMLTRSNRHRPVSVIVFQRGSIERFVQVPRIPDLAATDDVCRTNAAILPQLVELARRDSKIERSLNARESPPRARSRLRRGRRARHFSSPRRAVIEPSSKASAAAMPSRRGVSGRICS